MAPPWDRRAVTLRRWIFSCLASLALVSATSPCGTDQNPYCAGNAILEQLCCPYPNVCYWQNRQGEPGCCPHGQWCQGSPYNPPTTVVPPPSTVTITPTPTEPPTTHLSTITVPPPSTVVIITPTPTSPPTVHVITVTTFIPCGGGGGGGVVVVTSDLVVVTTTVAGHGACATVTSDVVGVWSTVTSGVVGVYSTVTTEVGQVFATVSGVLVGGATPSRPRPNWIPIAAALLGITWNNVG